MMLLKRDVATCLAEIEKLEKEMQEQHCVTRVDIYKSRGISDRIGD